MAPSAASATGKQRTQRTLPDLMATLPQELFDQIYEDVITTRPQAVRIKYTSRIRYLRPVSNLLQVSRATHEHVLSSYYASTTFICPVDVHCPAEFLACRFPERHLNENRIRSLVVYNNLDCQCPLCKGVKPSSREMELWRFACGDHTRIEGYGSLEQVHAALDGEGIEIVEADET
ncbi:hypothetical protein AC579_3936 [Pseudocercospora musae]|uniref:F-box domain-containing protein n=1 Tax=Pseudocercospora musae TaxID=113226 RepID=A0A139IKF0_9PEZI|nr:hypothetical protein AC579_3936 [Pseudocercospora musae]